MRQCPKCSHLTVDFDEYFGRFRCFNADCSWMPTTSAERRLRLVQARKSPKTIGSVTVPELQLTIEVTYDDVNDALVLAFDREEPSFEFPDDDVRVLWNVGRCSGQVLGVVILGAREFGISEVQLKIAANLSNVAQTVRTNPITLGLGSPTKTAIENVAVKLQTSKTAPIRETAPPSKLLDVMRRFSAEHAHS